jgi:uncharacterized protein (DUF302 family)
MVSGSVRSKRGVGYLLALVWLLAAAAAQASDNPALWRYQVKGEFDAVLNNLKSGLERAQFLIANEEDLARGLENNRHLLGGDYRWNVIGFERVTAVHFCSVLFNHEVFNADLDWSVLCPFKVVAYNLKESPSVVHIVTVRPTYLLKDERSKNMRELGQKIERRIVDAIKAGIALEPPKE